MYQFVVWTSFLIALLLHEVIPVSANPNLALPAPVGVSDCTDVAAQALGGPRATPSGKYYVAVGARKRGVWVYCDMDTAEGGWTVIQRRSGPEVDFYRTWKEYEQGFGDPDGDFWLGNTYLHSMTVNKRYVLRIDLTDWENKTCYAEYSNFVVGGAGCKYKLESIGDYCGDCGDALEYHIGRKFSTKDQDFDEYFSNYDSGSCAQIYKGAWWYRSCRYANLNGLYLVNGSHENHKYGVNWRSDERDLDYSFKKAEMKIRPYNY